MTQLWRVAMRELMERGRSKGFAVTTVVTFLIVLAIVFLPQVFGGGTSEYTVGSVGAGNEAIVEAATNLGNASDEPDDTPSVEFTIETFTNRSGAEAALDRSEVDVVLIDGKELVVKTIGISGSGVVGLLQQGAAAVALEKLLAEEGEAAAQVIEVLTSTPLNTTTLTGAGAEDSSKLVIAYAGLMFLYVAILLYGTWILTGVTEEKASRVVEVLLSSMRPWQLLGGKILGIGLLGMFQFVLTVVVALVALNFSGVDIPDLDPLVAANLVFWFVIGFLIYALLFGAAGSLASRIEDANNAALPMSMIAVVGLLVSFSALGDPTGTLARVSSLIPITSPFVVPVRVTLGAIEIWEFVAAVAIAGASIVALVWISGRIYAGGVLRYGSRISFREAWRSASD